MPSILTQPYNGPVTVDVTAFAAQLVDLAPGALRGLRREQPGIHGVIAELAANVPAVGAKASISQEMYAQFVQKNETLTAIRATRLIVDKLAEVLLESEVFYEDQREVDIRLIATAVRTTAGRRDDSVLAAFEKTLAYNGQAGRKAAKTRKKNEAEEGADDGSGDGAPNTAPQAAPQPAPGGGGEPASP